MKHSFIVLFASFALLCAAFAGGSRLTPAGRATAATRPTPTPTPVAIAYDQINRMAFGQMTPPPVGSFGQDYQRIESGIQSAAAPAPQAHPHGLAGMFAHALQIPERMQNPMLAMQNGTLKRYTFYWVRGWIRIDDPATHTAVIYKCKEHQTIYLDLAKKTYRIVTGKADVNAPVPEAPAGNPYARQMAAPGTAKMHVTTKATALGPKVVEGIDTHGYDTTNALAMTNATGSCKNGSFSSHVVEYISNIRKQRAYCPLPGRAAVYHGGTYGGPMGGCKPTMVVRQAGSVHPNAQDLAMYRLSSFAATQGQGASMVLERGNVTWLYNPQIPPLFEIPPGFTKTS